MRQFSLIFLSFALVTLGQSHAIAQFPGENAAPVDNTPPEIKQVKPGVYLVGGIRLEKANRTISFPAALNMKSAPLEYFLVTQIGKVHESLLRTAIDPRHINTALLLLNAKGIDGRPFPANTDTPIPGAKVTIKLSWTEDGKTNSVPAEKWVFNAGTDKTMSPGPWVYNGSKVSDGVFLAQSGGSIISLILDQAAVINNPRRGAENDDLWFAGTEGLPELETVVTVTIKVLDE